MNQNSDNEPLASSAGETPRRDRAGEFREIMKNAEKRRRKNLLLNILLVVFGAIFLVSGFFLFRYFHASGENKKLVSSLKEMIDTEGDYEETDPEGSSSETSEAEGKTTEADTGSGNSSGKKHTLPRFVNVDGKLIYRKYKALYQKNWDFLGWITIPDTDVDYPVMYTPWDEQKYLRKNFEGEYALAGTPFLAAESDPVRPADNLIIYGHNMKDGTMFSDIMKYEDQEFYDSHKLIRFDTIYGPAEYEVIAAFPARILNEGEEGFRYYTFFIAETPEEYDAYVREVLNLSSINTGITPAYGEQLLTLSTCDNAGASEGNRFVVVARKIAE